jgi:hypothetical protein
MGDAAPTVRKSFPLADSMTAYGREIPQPQTVME